MARWFKMMTFARSIYTGQYVLFFECYYISTSLFEASCSESMFQFCSIGMGVYGFECFTHLISELENCSSLVC